MQYFKTAADQEALNPILQAGTFYSYDIEGNVDMLLQDYVINSLDMQKDLTLMNKPIPARAKNPNTNHALKLLFMKPARPSVNFKIGRKKFV
ncbi:MAG TPA: hypothetical protein VHA52_04170 [Candidatus Babeliaceae bacterium]|nr:hypothetical protein [Candidatus Babeliaceae bacterium]